MEDSPERSGLQIGNPEGLTRHANQIHLNRPGGFMTEADREGIAQEIRQVVQEGFEMVAANDDFEGMMARAC